MKPDSMAVTAGVGTGAGIFQAKASSWPGEAFWSIPTEVVWSTSACSSSPTLSCFSTEINSVHSLSHHCEMLPEVLPNFSIKFNSFTFSFSCSDSPQVTFPP